VILGEEEKIGGLPVYPHKYDDFIECLTSSGLDDVNFSGNPSHGGMAGQMVNQYLKDWIGWW